MIEFKGKIKKLWDNILDYGYNCYMNGCQQDSKQDKRLQYRNRADELLDELAGIRKELDKGENDND